MKQKRVLVLAACICLVAILALPSCTQPEASTPPAVTVTVTATPTASATSAAPQKEILKVLNPQGNPSSVECKALSPRLDKLDGKKILFYQSEANNVQLPSLLKRLRNDYPTTTFDVIYTEGFGDESPTADQKKYDACIRGIGWCGGATTTFARYICDMEMAGIPSVFLAYADQESILRNTALMRGCPNIRYVAVPRIGHGEEMVATYYAQVPKALTDPLTAKEKESGIYVPPSVSRILFEGNSDEAQDFLQQTTLVGNCRMCPIAKYTDGLPVIIPTEEKVTAMLTGTSHKGTEVVTSTSTIQAGGMMKNPQTAGAPLDFGQSRTATVEKVAICAVMAGCMPQYMPVVLAMASTGGGYMGYYQTSSPQATWFVVSGPIAKEIGMNAGQNALDTGNRANMTLGRVPALMWVNFGGQITGIGRSDSGNPVHSICFAEDLEGLPEGWVGFNQESTHLGSDGKTMVNYTDKESVLGRGGSGFSSAPSISFPGYYRSLNQGEMGIARMLGVEGTPGYYNWLKPVLDRYWTGSAGGIGFVMHLNLAQMLYLAGFKSKADVYKWMYDNYFLTVADYYNTGLWEFQVAEFPVEATSGKTWDELLATDPGYRLHRFGGGNYMSNCIIVADSFQDEHWYITGRPQATGIDYWK